VTDVYLSDLIEGAIPTKMGEQLPGVLGNKLAALVLSPNLLLLVSDGAPVKIGPHYCC
jgi:hypothetical protein